jgi:branched-chain amino acid transport system permease protein
MDYYLHILILICIYTILAISLDLLIGHLGLLSVAHAAFYGLGAYASTLLSIHFNTPFVTGVLISMGIAALLSLLVSAASLRLYGDYFVIATFGFQMVLLSIVTNWVEVTNGPLGIRDIPPADIFGVIVTSKTLYLLLAVIFVIITFAVVWRMTHSPFGRVLRAIREDEVYTKSLGKNTSRFKAVSFAVSAGFAALAGCLYAHYVTYIDPTSFSTTESILIISMVIVGGAGNPLGATLGAVVLVILPEALRFVGLPTSVAANLRQVIYGSLLVLMMSARPRGLIGRYGFGR